MCFESLIGYSFLAIAAIGYVASIFARKVNWNLHMYYFKRLVNTW